jgi:hypothetical protein
VNLEGPGEEVIAVACFKVVSWNSPEETKKLLGTSFRIASRLRFETFIKSVGLIKG